MFGRTIAVATVAGTLCVIGGSPFSASLLAQASCTQEMNRQDAALRQYGADAKREGMSFAANDVGKIALDKVKLNLKGDPTADAAAEAKARWDEYQDYMNHARDFMDVLKDLAQCSKGGGASGCWDELMQRAKDTGKLMDKVSDATNKWLDSLNNESISKAAERVEKARGVMQKLTDNAGNMATDAMTGAMNNCFKDFDQRVQNASNSNPVNLSNPAPQVRPVGNGGGSAGSGGSGASSGGSTGGQAAAASGGGAGHAAGAIVGIGGGIAGTYFVAKELQTLKCNKYETEANSRLTDITNALNSLIACGSSQSCFNSRNVTFNNSLSALNTTLGNWCTCLGASTKLSASDKAMITDAFNSLRSAGVSPGTLPACFR